LTMMIRSKTTGKQTAKHRETISQETHFCVGVEWQRVM